MRILTFGHLPSWAGGRQESGLANVIYQLAKHGSELDGVEVALAATDSYILHRKDDRLLILGWTKYSLISHVILHPISSISSLRVLRKLKKKYPIEESTLGLYMKRLFFEKCVKEIRPQIVHLHGPSAVWYQDLIPPKSGFSVTFHGISGIDDNVKQHQVLFKMEHDIYHSTKVSGVIFICSKLVKDFYEAYGDNKKDSHVIFNSYDNTQFYFKANRSNPSVTENNSLIKLYTVASLSDLKGQIRVLTALATLSNKRNFQYYCIGGGTKEYVEKLHQLANKNSISFKYLGKMKPAQIREALYEADYMIMPSSSEGFGLTYLESIACGIPVILPRELPIAQEKNLINDNNSVLLDDCSSQSIAVVLNNIHSYSFNHEEVANTISGYTWDDIVQDYFKVYQELLK